MKRVLIQAGIAVVVAVLTAAIVIAITGVVRVDDLKGHLKDIKRTEAQEDRSEAKEDRETERYRKALLTRIAHLERLIRRAGIAVPSGSSGFSSSSQSSPSQPSQEPAPRDQPTRPDNPKPRPEPDPTVLCVADICI